MAVVTFVKYKSGKNATPSALKGVIDYCNQPYKTQVEEQIYSISGKDCNGEFAFREFMATKKLYSKSDGVMFYHYVQSFSPEENITPEEAKKIGLELAKEFDGFEVLVATHIDREHIHSHLIINSVNFDTGYKLRQNPNSLQKLRNKSDEICIQFSKTVLPKYQKPPIKGLCTREYRVAEKGQSWKFQLMNAIDKAMNQSGSREDFEKQMQNFGYELLWTDTRKYITFTCPNKMKCRDIKLHDQKYLKENLEYEFRFRENVLGGQAQTEQRNGDIKDGERTISPDRLCTQRSAAEQLNDLAQRSWRVPTGALQSNFTAGDLEGSRQMVSGYTGNRSGLYGKNGAESADGESEKSSIDAGSSQSNAGEFVTGWEKSRGIYFENLITNGRKDNSTGLSDIKIAPQDFADFNRHSTGLGTALSSGLSSASRIIDDDNEDQEERKKRIQAQENGDALGTLIGLAIGLATDISENTAEETEDESLHMEM